MGKFCLYIDEPHYPTESRFVENSLVIVFSVSGESRDTIGHVMRFKEQNCQILSVTNTENCTIAKLSDYNLAYYVTYERLGVYDVTTQLPAMSIVERLGKSSTATPPRARQPSEKSPNKNRVLPEKTSAKNGTCFLCPETADKPPACVYNGRIRSTSTGNWMT